jgi:hypothetical protein
LSYYHLHEPVAIGALAPKRLETSLNAHFRGIFSKIGQSGHVAELFAHVSEKARHQRRRNRAQMFTFALTQDNVYASPSRYE